MTFVLLHHVRKGTRLSPPRSLLFNVVVRGENLGTRLGEMQAQDCSDRQMRGLLVCEATCMKLFYRKFNLLDLKFSIETGSSGGLMGQN